MPLTIEQFTQQLTSSGLMTEDGLREWLKSESFEQRPSDGEALARELVKRKKLTKFQASQIYAGKGASLVLGNYVILDKLGQGGMGMVLKAEHKRMKRLVAVKVISAAAMKSKDAVQRFHREVEAAAKLTHSNIVNAHDADEAKGTHFLVMEYVEGEDLYALVKKAGPMSANAAIDAILQAARGLEYAHKRGVIHRDIKPANLLLDKEGTVKILDMGLARIESSELGAPQAELTNTGAIMGTIDYMSPEQAEDTKHADARSDIYSLGCSLYYVLTGHAVYTADTVMKKLLAHRDEPLPSLVADAASVRTDASSVGHGLDTIFRKMIAKKASDRYQSMTEVIAALEQCRAGNSSTFAQSTEGNHDSGNELQRFLRDMTDDDPDATFVQPIVAVASLPKRSRTKTTDPLAEETMNSAADDAQTESRLGLRPDPNRKVGTESQPTRRAVAIGLAAVILLLAGVILFVQTNRGTLRIEINDPQIEVSVHGTDIVVKDEGQEDIQLKPGEHTLHVKRGDLEFDTDAFTLKKGETIAVKVERVGRRVRAMRDKQLLGHREDPKPKTTTTTATGWHGWSVDAPPPAIAPFNAEQAKQHQEAWAKYLNVPVEYTNSIGMKFRLIPPGEFTMGSTKGEIEETLKFADSNDKQWLDGIRSEFPQHKVILTQPVYFGANEVTQGEYEKVMGQNPSHFAPLGAWKEAAVGRDTTRHPVENVSWNDAAKFCSKLSEREKLKPFNSELRAGETVTIAGAGCRLPTEAEWEFACRAGTTTKYWIGDTDEDLVPAGWFDLNSGGRTHAAGELKANPFGLFDVHGNVWEWVEDGWDPTYYGEFQDKAAINPNAPIVASSERVIRGGRWYHAASCCRSSGRGVHASTFRYGSVGFRVSLLVDAVRQALKGTEPAMPKSVAATPSASPDRRIAEWVLKLGGSATIRQNDNEQAITNDGQLPQENFDLIKVNFEGTAAVNDENVGTLRDALRLRHLGLGHTSVSDNGLEWIGELTQLESVNLWHSKTTGKTVARMRPLSELRELLLNSTSVGDDAFRGFSNTKNLERLLLANTQLTDASTPLLTQFSNLSKLELGGNSITATGIERLEPLQNLQYLGLTGTSFEAAEIKALAKIRGLRNLTVGSLRIRDNLLEPLESSNELRVLELPGSSFEADSAASLGRLRMLRELNFYESNVRDADLIHVATLPDLEVLKLPKTGIGDKGLIYLEKTKTLRQVDLKGSKVTKSGVEKLHQALPQCRIEWDGGVIEPQAAE